MLSISFIYDLTSLTSLRKLRVWEIILKMTNTWPVLEQREVEKCLLSLKINKSPGPDKISGILLKSCAKQLSPIFHPIFNVSLSQQKVPRLSTELIPVPKVSRPKTLNDFRPVALTSLLMKSCTWPHAICLQGPQRRRRWHTYPAKPFIQTSRGEQNPC